MYVYDSLDNSKRLKFQCRNLWDVKVLVFKINSTIYV